MSKKAAGDVSGYREAVSLGMGMDRRPLVWFAAAWVCGSAAAAGLGVRGALLVAGAAALLAAAAALSRLASWRLAMVCLLALSLAAGQRLWADSRNATQLQALLAAAEAAEDPRAAFPAEASGTIVSAVEIDGDRVQFRLEADAVQAGGERQPLKGGERLIVQLRLDAEPELQAAAAWQRGDRVTVAGELTRPATAGNSGGFDYRRYLSSQRIHWLLKARGASAVTASAEAPSLSAAALLGRVDAARAWLGARLAAMYPPEQSGYMQALVLGLKDEVDPELYNGFSRLGLTHVLAISGLHVGVFMMGLGGLLRLLRLPRERILLVLMAAVPLYCLLSGAAPSVLRAGIMAVLGLVAARMGKLKDGMHLIAAAAIILLVFDPYYLNNVSFQLSFAVTLGLIAGVPPVRNALPCWRGFGWLRDLAAVTLVAQLVSFPLTIYYFNQFHLLSLPANMLLVPVISSAVMPLGALSLLMSLCWQGGADMLAMLSSRLNGWTFAAVEALSGLETFRTIWPSPPLWWIGCWMAVLAAAFRLLGIRNGRRTAALHRLKEAEARTAPLDEPLPGASPSLSGSGDERRANKPPGRLTVPSPIAAIRSRALLPWSGLALAAAMLLGYAYAPDRFDRSGTVSFLDVGQGDAALVRTPEGRHILIDGGGAVSYRKPGDEWRERREPFEVGAKVVVPLLMKRGVREIDLLIVSHLDSDHIRGLLAVAESIPIRQMWWNGTLKEGEDATALMKAALERNIPLFAVSEGMERAVDRDTRLQVLWPPRQSAESSVPFVRDQNEWSVVLRLELYGRPFVFSGDIGAATERLIVRKELERQGEGAVRGSVTASGRAEKHEATPPILKIAHHGSRYSTSEEWLLYWSPAAAVVSVSAWNTYGHPHPDTVGRVKRTGAALWRTDRDGEVSFRVTKKEAFASNAR